MDTYDVELQLDLLDDFDALARTLNLAKMQMASFKTDLKVAKMPKELLTMFVRETLFGDEQAADMAWDDMNNAIRSWGE